MRFVGDESRRHHQVNRARHRCLASVIAAPLRFFSFAVAAFLVLNGTVIFVSLVATSGAEPPRSQFLDLL